MLSRTADHLFWMSRYTERAENTARMLDVNYQTSLLPQSSESAMAGWTGLLGEFAGSDGGLLVPSPTPGEAVGGAPAVDESWMDLVVKEVHGAGGYGMLVGPAATAQEIADFRKAVEAKPEGYIAQPTLSLSTCPTYVEQGIAPRHIDLRPFVLSGKEVQMVPGGLTRVALKEGSLVVNSSQGGGTKDTWILEE